MIAVTRKWPDAHPTEFLAMAVVLWVALYWLLRRHPKRWLQPYRWIARVIWRALQFFLYDTPKVLLLLTGIVVVSRRIEADGSVAECIGRHLWGERNFLKRRNCIANEGTLTRRCADSFT